jgi:hypothetical protein
MADIREQATAHPVEQDRGRVWSAPKIYRLEAGMAELGDISVAEGNGQFS